jgi:tRNA (guanine-N7-)-methyltransferase
VRTIKSYVKRKGRITDGQNQAINKLWPRYGIDYSSKSLDFSLIFENNNPVHLEVGFGDGESLITQAASNPNKNYLGIEVHDPGIGRCLMNIEKYGLTNIKLSSHDAIEVINDQINQDTIERVNLYFPDPWPKKKHHKRRIVQPTFLDMIGNRLKEGGTFNIATDWAAYAEQIDEVFSHSDHFICSERREHNGELPFMRPRTKFENRGLKKGHRIWDWCFKKSNA